jgi:hypothetical protein
MLARTSSPAKGLLLSAANAGAGEHWSPPVGPRCCPVAIAALAKVLKGDADARAQGVIAAGAAACGTP